MHGIQGKYFSFTSASVVAGDDLISKAESLTGESNIVAKKINLIASGSLSFSVNGGSNSTLFKDTDGYYRLSLSDFDCMVSSIAIAQTSACPVFVSIVY